MKINPTDKDLEKFITNISRQTAEDQGDDIYNKMGMLYMFVERYVKLNSIQAKTEMVKMKKIGNCDICGDKADLIYYERENMYICYDCAIDIEGSYVKLRKKYNTLRSKVIWAATHKEIVSIDGIIDHLIKTVEDLDKTEE